MYVSCVNWLTLWSPSCYVTILNDVQEMVGGKDARTNTNSLLVTTYTHYAKLSLPRVNVVFFGVRSNTLACWDVLYCKCFTLWHVINDESMCMRISLRVQIFTRECCFVDCGGARENNWCYLPSNTIFFQGIFLSLSLADIWKIILSCMEYFILHITQHQDQLVSSLNIVKCT